MALSKTGKALFLAQHPLCCFCGGARPTVEPDHVPSRAFFHARQWPEGYEFPACVSCNRVTRHDEQVVAMLSRLYPDPVTKEEVKEMEERIRAVAHNYPQILEDMRPTARQLRSVSKKYGVGKPAGKSYADLPALSVNGPLVNAAVENFSRKLFCALYYKHAGQILRNTGGIAVRWFSNLQIENDEISRSLTTVLNEFPKIERSRTNLDDQFFYRWGIADTKEIAAFLVFFRRSFAIVGYVHQRAAEFHLPQHTRIVRLYDAQPALPADAAASRRRG